MAASVFIVWKDEYSVGHDELDSHHKDIIAIINDLYGAIREQAGEERLEEILERLLEYTQFHFSFEEREMKDREYPGLVEHRIVHEGMVARTRGLRKKSIHEKNVAQEAMAFLKEWWLGHIREVDMRYRPYVGTGGG